MKKFYIKAGAVLVACIVRSEILTLALVLIGAVILVSKTLGTVWAEEDRTRGSRWY